jgi:hypothetical protein
MHTNADTDMQMYIIKRKVPGRSSTTMPHPTNQRSYRKGITVLDHSPYSPVLAPADLWLFPEFKLAMKGDRHDTIQDIQRECTAVLNVIPQKKYSDCFQKLLNRFQLYIDSDFE